MQTNEKLQTAISLLSEVLAEQQPANRDPDKKLYTTDEVAARLGLRTPQTLRNWVQQGCPVVRAGRVLRFDLDAVVAWNAARGGAR